MNDHQDRLVIVNVVDEGFRQNNSFEDEDELMKIDPFISSELVTSVV